MDNTFHFKELLSKHGLVFCECHKLILSNSTFNCTRGRHSGQLQMFDLAVFTPDAHPDTTPTGSVFPPGITLGYLSLVWQICKPLHYGATRHSFNKKNKKKTTQYLIQSLHILANLSAALTQDSSDNLHRSFNSFFQPEH